MTAIRKIQIALVAVVAMSAGVLAVLNRPSPAPRVFDIDPSIATIIITAKRLPAGEPVQAVKDEAGQANRAVTAKNPPADKLLPSGALAPLMLLDERA